MRVIAGRLGGRNFNSPGGNRTHPMSDKIRGALFNSLADVSGLIVLDAFAGTGALSFEALSRGADSAVLVEIDRKAQHTLTENIQLLGLEQQAKLITANVHGWMKTNDQRFDLVLLDPPFDRLQEPLLERLASRVKPGGRLVLSWPANGRRLPVFPDCQLSNQKNYGDANLYFYDKL